MDPDPLLADTVGSDSELMPPINHAELATTSFTSPSFKNWVKRVHKLVAEDNLRSASELDSVPLALSFGSQRQKPPTRMQA